MPLGYRPKLNAKMVTLVGIILHKYKPNWCSRNVRVYNTDVYRCQINAI